ncbi:MAG TPA: hypothetical protein GXZ66_08365 [Clostridiaceae bacterium]|jgi:YD repeat-containing protein|nr:hypothetical protein [Clostridiaceae bacterium]
MGKRITTVCIILGTLLMLAACNSSTEYLLTKEINLDADCNVESYITYEYENDEQNIVKKTMYNEEDEIEFYNVIRYDEQGREIESTNFNKDGQIEGVTNWIYDETGYKIVELKEGREAKEVVDVTLNENGDVAIMEFLDTGIVEEYEYDENGFLVMVKSTLGDVTTFTKYINDEKGKVLKAEYYVSEDNVIFYTRYYYDIKGNLVGEKEFYSNGNLINEKEYEYKKK